MLARAETEQRVATICLLLISAVVVGAALRWLKPVMIPFVLALFVSMGLTPVVNMQTRHLKMPRPVALLSTLAMAFLLFTALAALVTASIGELTANASAYEEKFHALLDYAASVLPVERDQLRPELLLAPLSKFSVGTVSGMLLTTTNAVLSTLSQSLLVFVFSIYLLSGAGRPEAPTARVWLEIESRISRYVVTKAIISGATGLLVWMVLAILGVDLALVFGLFAFLLNFIPSIGSIIATLLPLPIVLFSPGISPTEAVLAITIPGAIQLSVGNVVEPLIMGDSLDLHPVAILMALMIWGMLWGVVGMLLATPITAVMKILFERIETTRPFAALLAGRLESSEQPR